MQVNDLKNELASIVKDLKTRVEFEKTFGIDVISLSTQNKREKPSITITHEKDLPEGLPPQTKPFNKKTFTINNKENKVKLLEELKNEMLVCHKCPLSKTRTNLVFGVGNPMANLMFVGEAPGRDEDLQGEPFVGRAGQLLTKIIEAIGMKRSDVYIANILKCRPPGNRNPLPDEIALCMPALIKQIEIIQPKVLCALGTFAAQTLLNTKASIGSLRGKFHDYKGIPTMATFHPAYLLRNPNEKGKVWEDMKKVRDFLKELLNN
ncbi:MAG: uracil-DNA glycosylase [Candidatus Kuenenia sp.]|nr:uracil-DNA glycosylase [Candidatus Kuenenia hertensis]